MKRSQLFALFIFYILFTSLSSCSRNPFKRLKSVINRQEVSTTKITSSSASSTTHHNNSGEDVVIRAEVNSFIARIGSVKSAFKLASLEGYQEVVFYLLEHEQIDKDDVNGALEAASSEGHTEIVFRLLHDDRIEESTIRNSFLSANLNGHQKIVLFLLNDQRFEAGLGLEASHAKVAFFTACEKGSLDVVSHFLKDDRIEADDVKRAFDTAYRELDIGSGHSLKRVILCLSQDVRIEPIDVKKAFQTACKDGHIESIDLLIKDKRIETVDLNEGFRNLPSISDNLVLSLFLDDERLDPSIVKASFLHACAQKNDPIIYRLLKDSRLDSDAVNQGFKRLSRHSFIAFLENGKLEPLNVGIILKNVFAHSNDAIFYKLKNLSPKAVVGIKKELAEAVKRFPLPPHRLDFLFRQHLLNIFDLDFVGISKVTGSSDFFACLFKVNQSSEMLLGYYDKLQAILSNIIDKLDKDPDFLAKEIDRIRIPRLSLHVFNAIQLFIENTNLNESFSSRIFSFIEKIVLLLGKLKLLSNIPHFELARLSLLVVPKSVLSSLQQIVAKSEWFDGSPMYEFLQEVTSANINREEYWSAFEKNLNMGYSKELKVDTLRKFLNLHLGSDLFSNEMENVRTMIVEDINNSDRPKTLDDICKCTNYVVTYWIVRTWNSGNRDLFDLVLKALTNHWEGKESVDELIKAIAKQAGLIVGLKLLYVADVDVDVGDILDILRRAEMKNNEKNLVMFENVSFENIHELPLNDETFFGPSFRLISDRNNPRLDFRDFRVKYFNEIGVDGGGPSRNWIEKMLHAMADPKRQFLKTHGVKNELVPDIGVHSKVFFALGRLIGKAIKRNTGLPFAFHPKWILIMKEPQDKKFIKQCFKDFYEEELRMIDSLLTYTLFEEVGDFKFAAPEEWRSTTARRSRNFMLFNVQDANRAEPKSAFNPKTKEEIEEFVKMSRKRSLLMFEANISSFMEGLNIYIRADLLILVKTPILLRIFSPSPEINVDSLLAAFNLDSGEEFNVEVSEEDLANIDANVTVMSSAGSNGPSRISAKDAFRIAIKRLESNLLPGLLGQITGSRSIGFKNLQPRMFIVNFYQIYGSRSLFGEGPSSREEVKLPIASSCNLSLTMPAYRTLKEMCDALELLARAADDFAFR